MPRYARSKKALKGRNAPLRALFLVSYIDILALTRKSVKGLRLTHLTYIMIIGEYPQGVRLYELVNVCGKERSGIHKGVGRAIKAGWIKKDGAVYSLTIAGDGVYVRACRSFAAVWDELTTEVARRAAEKITR